MLAFIRRHQTWGLIFIALVIVSFVVFFSPNQRYGSGGTGVVLPTVYGKQVSQEEYRAAYREASLGLVLRYGSANDQRARRWLEPETMRRLVLLKQLKELQIHVSDRAVAKRIAEFPEFKDPKTQVFDYRRYEAFVTQSLNAQGYSKADFEAFLRHEIGRQQLMAVAGLAGDLIPPGDAEIDYRREHEQVTVELAVFSSSNYLARVKLDPDELTQFFTNRQALYRIPERIQVSYVKFDLTNYLAGADQELNQVTNLDLQINEYYQQRGTNAFKDEQGNVMSAAAAQAQIRDAQREQYALKAARAAATAFANELYQQPVSTNSLSNFAAAKGLESKVTEPFTQNEVPLGLKVSRDFTRRAFALSAKEPLALPFVGEDGVYVFGLWNTLPSTVPPFDLVRAQVIEDYRRYTARQLAQEAGTAFAKTLTNALAQRKSFEAVCAEAHVTPVSVPAFSASTRSLPELPRGISVGEVQTATDELEVGKVSAFRSTAEGGFVALVKSRAPVDEAKLKADLPTYTADLRQTRQMMAFEDWFTHELQQAGIDPRALQPAED